MVRLVRVSVIRVGRGGALRELRYVRVLVYSASSVYGTCGVYSVYWCIGVYGALGSVCGRRLV